MGFWTLDNSFLLSRVRIAHGGARPAPFEDGKSALFEDAKVVNLFDGETPTTVTRETMPKQVVEALTAKGAEFKAVDGIDAVVEKTRKMSGMWRTNWWGWSRDITSSTGLAAGRLRCNSRGD